MVEPVGEADARELYYRWADPELEEKLADMILLLVVFSLSGQS